MPEVPDEGALLEMAMMLVSNASNWEGNPPSQDTRSIEWRETARKWLTEYHNWLGYYIFTHSDDVDDEHTTGDLIEALKLICPCGDCDGAWLTRHEAEAIIRRLKNLAIQDRDSSTTG